MQWLVDFFGLYTPIDRKRFGKYFLLAIKYAYVCYVIILTYLMFDPTSTLRIKILYGISVLLTSATIILPYFTFERIFANQKDDGTLPQEIITRKRIRSTNIIVYVTLILFESWVLGLPGESSTFLLFWIFSFILFLFLLYAFEYFLCTTSLPPGEKERRKLQNELKNMITETSTR